jgi:hypothetical protein
MTAGSPTGLLLSYAVIAVSTACWPSANARVYLAMVAGSCEIA